MLLGWVERKAETEWPGIGPGLSTLTSRSERCVASHVGRKLAEWGQKPGEKSCLRDYFSLHVLHFPGSASFFLVSTLSLSGFHGYQDLLQEQCEKCSRDKHQALTSFKVSRKPGRNCFCKRF